MALSLRPRHLTRYRQLARLLVKYGRSDLVRQTGLDAVLQDDDARPEEVAEAEGLADDLEAMGATFIKLGQLLSTRTDLLPTAYTKALSRLQDDVAPIPFTEVEEVVTTELGVRLSKAFDSFDEQPLAAASLGQVHRAVLRGGRRVVVKVQRPGVRRQVLDDMDVLEDIAGFLDAHTERAQRFALGDLLEQFRRSLLEELDYRREASNLVRLGRIVSERPLILVPQPHDDYTTSRVLTMDEIEGRKVTDLSPIAQLELDGATLADELLSAYLDQILVEGFFHADPHPGNVLLTADGKLALIDLGMVARVPTALRQQLIRLLLAVSESRGEEVTRILAAVSTQLPDYDESKFTRVVSELVERAAEQSMDELDAGTIVMDLARASALNGLQPPAELSMLGKALLNLDQVARTLDPRFQPIETVRRHTVAILRSSVPSTPGSLISAMLEARDFAEQLPGRVNRVMDAVSNGHFELKVRAIDETEFLRGLHKMANRVATGLVLSALIIGAALLSQVRTTSRILGYPSVALVFFVIAAVGGLALVVSVVTSDRRLRRRRWRG